MMNLNYSANFTTRRFWSPEILILKLKMLFEFQNEMNVEITWFQLMHLGFALGSSDKVLWDIDLLDTGIPSKHFVCIQDVLRRLRRNHFLSSKKSSRHLQDIFAKDVLEDKKKRYKTMIVIERYWSHFQDVLKTNKCFLRSDKEHQNVLKVWNKFDMKKMETYHNL